MTDEERQKLAGLHAIGNCDVSIGPDTHALCKWAADEIERKMTDEELNMLETAANLLEQLAHELVATNKRLEQLEARVEALERM